MTATLTTEQIVEAAYEATKDLPAFDNVDRFRNILEYINDQGAIATMESEVIRECRKKVGLA